MTRAHAHGRATHRRPDTPETRNDGDGATPDPGRVEGERLPDGVGQGRDEAQPDRQDPRGQAPLPRHPRLRGDRRPPDPERHPLASTTCSSSASAARPRRGCSASSSTCSTTPCRSSRARRSTTTPTPRSRSEARDRVAAMGDATPIAWVGRDARYQREARHPRRDDRRPDRRGRHDQARRGALPLQRADHALRPDPPRQPGHLLHERAARPLPQDPGRPVQRPGRARRPDPRLSRPARPRPLHGLLGQPRGLHQSRPDRHPAEGPDRLGRPHPLPADPRPGHRDHRPERLARPRRRHAGDPPLHQGDRRGGLAAGPVVARTSTSSRASRCGCRSPTWRTSSPTPSAGPCSTASAGSSRASRTCVHVHPQLARQARTDDDRGRRPGGQARSADRSPRPSRTSSPSTSTPRTSAPAGRLLRGRARGSRSATRCRRARSSPAIEKVPEPPQEGRGGRRAS